MQEQYASRFSDGGVYGGIDGDPSLRKLTALIRTFRAIQWLPRSPPVQLTADEVRPHRVHVRSLHHNLPDKSVPSPLCSFRRRFGLGSGNSRKYLRYAQSRGGRDFNTRCACALRQALRFGRGGGELLHEEIDQRRVELPAG